MSGDFRKLANLRVIEARALIKANSPSGAYYLAGYAVECALKACVAAQFRRYTIPEKKLISDLHTHDLEVLTRIAQIDGLLAQEIQLSPGFATNWATTKDWDVSSRYRQWSMREARDLYRAVNARTDGVLRWIKQYW